ncbi:MAG: hypothetical protein M3Y64_11125 [Gemmatimonadota bacterium]|nr:hypothetical protein [Gemmatimonadota bacterium]
MMLSPGRPVIVYRILFTRPQRARLRVAAILAVGGAAACGGSKGDAAAKAAATPVASAVRSPCPSDGLWKNCEVIEHLSRAGVAPHEEPADTTHVPFLAPPGIHFRVGKNSTLIAFFYADSLQAKKAWAALDTMRLGPAGDTTSHWPKVPAPIRAGNLVAAFFSESPRQTERVRRALTAGLPAPQKSK